MSAGTRYAKSGDVHLAYQVSGAGPDLVFVPGWVSNVELWSEDSAWRTFLERLASFSRLIIFDKRGTGLSDRVSPSEMPTLEERMDDVRAVMDAAGSTSAHVLGLSEGGPMAILFAATHPERVKGLILYGSFPRITRDRGYAWGFPPEQVEPLMALAERTWGEGTFTGGLFMSPEEREARLPFLARFEREGASPGAMLALIRMLADIDVRDVLPSIAVPTLIVHRVGDAVAPVEGARYMATRIPNARVLEFPGSHAPVTGDTGPILDAIEEFVTGSRRVVEPDAVLATVGCIDVAGGRQRAAARDDAAWNAILDGYHGVARREIQHYGGREFESSSESLLALFDGPARAVRAACAIRDAVQTMGLEVRAGVHTGEVTVSGDTVRGTTVQICMGIAAVALPNEVLASGTVGDLTPGSGIAYESRGEIELRGVTGRWRLLAVGDGHRAEANAGRDAPAALALLSGLDHVQLSAYTVVGRYARYDEEVRNRLRDVRNSIAGCLEQPGRKRNTYLIHAAPGSGKTYFVEEVARTLGDVHYREINLANTDELPFKTALSDEMAKEGARRLLFIDECDAKQDQAWPYELVLPVLDAAVRDSVPIAFVLAGSHGATVEAMTDHLKGRPKGADLLSRIPASNICTIAPLNIGDRLLVALAHLRAAAHDAGREATAVEKMALLYLLLDARLTSARQIREFCVRAVERLGPGEDRVKYDHMFGPGDPENKAFWTRWDAYHSALADHFLLLRD